MDKLQQLLGGVLALLLVILAYLQRRRRTSSNCYSPPEPDGAWPIIGHLPMLMRPQLLHKALGALADKYGPVFVVRNGAHKTLVVSSWEIAKECFTTNDRVLASRPSSIAVKMMGYNSALLAFAPYGSYWREARKLVILELLSNRRIELLKHHRISEVSTSMKELYQIWQKSYSTGEALVELKHWSGDLSLNVISRMVVGKRYAGAGAVKMDDDEGRRFQKAIADFLQMVQLFVVSDALPFLGWMDYFQGHKQAMTKTAKELDSIMGKWLDEHRQSLKNDGEKVGQDLMYVMLSILDDQKMFEFEADTVTKALCLNMIFGAGDTTTVTLTWAISLLVNNPHILKKAQDEIDTIVGKERVVDESDMEKLVYLQAIIKETLRLYPAAPLSAQHEAMEDCIIGGYHVPAGTRLITNLWKIQQDPRVWSSPSEFLPERFLITQENVDFKGQHFEYIPFGAGRRSCPGMSFGLHVINLTLGRLLQGFHLRTPLDAIVDMTESPGITNLKATPLQILISPRLRPDFY